MPDLIDVNFNPSGDVRITEVKKLAIDAMRIVKKNLIEAQDAVHKLHYSILDHVTPPPTTPMEDWTPEQKIAEEARLMSLASITDVRRQLDRFEARRHILAAQQAAVLALVNDRHG